MVRVRPITDFRDVFSILVEEKTPRPVNDHDLSGPGPDQRNWDGAHSTVPRAVFL